MNRTRQENSNRIFRPSAHLLSALLIGVLLLPSQLMAATVNASVDRQSMALNETLEFSLRVDEQGLRGEPDFSALELFFDILNRHKSQQLRIINGDKQAWTEWRLTLAPKVDGVINIPAIEFAGGRSQPIQVEVQVAGNDPGRAQQDYYMELVYDQDQPVYVGQQVLLKVRLASAVPLSSLKGVALEIDQGVPADVVKLDEQQYEQMLKGRRYGVYEISYALFPETDGTLKIPAQQFTARVNEGSSLFDRQRGKRIRLQTEPRDIRVLPKPQGFSGDHWLVAEHVRMSRQFSRGPYRVGEPITLTLKLEADGLPAQALPDIHLPALPGFKVYPEQPSSEQRLNHRGARSSRLWRYGLVPTEAGTLQLPAMQLAWWDVRQDRERRIDIPAQTLEVQPTTVAAPIPPLPQSPASQQAGLEKQPSQQSAPQNPAPQKPAAQGLSPTLGEEVEATARVADRAGSLDTLAGMLLVHLIWAAIALLLLLLGYRWGRGHRVAALARTDHADNAVAEQREAAAWAQLRQHCQQVAEKIGTEDSVALRQDLRHWLQCFLALQDQRFGDLPQSLGELSRHLAERQPGAASQTLLDIAAKLDRQAYQPRNQPALRDQTPLAGVEIISAVQQLRKQADSAQAETEALPSLYP